MKKTTFILWILTSAIVGGQIGFRLRGDMVEPLLQKYRTTLEMCNKHIQAEEAIEADKKFYQQYQERQNKKPGLIV